MILEKNGDLSKSVQNSGFVQIVCKIRDLSKSVQNSGFVQIVCKIRDLAQKVCKIRDLSKKSVQNWVDLVDVRKSENGCYR